MEFQCDYAISPDSLHEFLEGIDQKLSRKLENEMFVSSWYLTANEGFCYINLTNDWKSIGVQSDNLDFLAELAIWTRKQVPERCKLFVYTANTWDKPVELRAEDNPQSVLERIRESHR
jgi:hypothetical protein